MKIIPVIDLKDKKAVRAYKGEREKYSYLMDAVELAKIYKHHGFTSIYVADLDSITYGFSKKSNFDTILEISNLVDVIVDFGIQNFEEYLKISKKINKNMKIIIGTETYKSENFPDDCIISLDTADGNLIGNFDFDNLLKQLKNLPNEIIVLDMKKIGTKNINLELCEKVYSKIGKKFIYGGGVTSKNLNKIEKFCHSVLMGTEIYENLKIYNGRFY